MAIDAAVFADMWGTARTRVLTRYAAQSREAAANLRERTARFPGEESQMLAEADNLDRYADACELAAADPSLPTPEHLPEES